MYSFFSVTTAKQKLYTGVVGTLPIVQLSANRNIGTENIKECAEENDNEIFFYINFMYIWIMEFLAVNFSSFELFLIT